MLNATSSIADKRLQKTIRKDKRETTQYRYLPNKTAPNAGLWRLRTHCKIIIKKAMF